MPNYWAKTLISRRRALRAAAAGATGIAALSLLACSGDDDGGSSDDGGDEVLDSKAGKHGGTLVFQPSSGVQNFTLVSNGGAEQGRVASFTHSSLLTFKFGRPPNSRSGPETEPDLAQTMPEQAPDQLSYTFKLKNAKFQNGRQVTSEDVKYSFDRWANLPTSAFRTQFPWYERVDTPDPMTAVLRTKYPYADALGNTAQHTTGFILAKEHEEGPDAATKLMGSGPFIQESHTPGINTIFRRNPDFYDQPYPYFDKIEMLGSNDPERQVANFLAGQVHSPYGFNYSFADRIRAGRSDIKEWQNTLACHYLVMRMDQAPFNDKRVRQALSMTIDRKKIREATTKGDGRNDQIMSPSYEGWGFRWPEEVGAASKNWNFDVQTARQLLSAAGIQTPIETDYYHWDATVIGQAFFDHAILTQATWSENNIVKSRDISETPAAQAQRRAGGGWSGIDQSPNGLMNNPLWGVLVYSHFYAPPEGFTPPFPNQGRINNPDLNTAVERQLRQLNLEERKATLRRVEEILADEMYRIPYSNYNNFYFADAKLRNNQPSRFQHSASSQYFKYWWFV